MKIKSLISSLLFVVIGFAILYMLFQHQQNAYQEECILQNIPLADCSLFDRIVSDFKTVKWIWIIVISVIFMISNIFRSFRWNQILATENYHISKFNSMAALMVGYFANLGLPRVGEIVRSGIITKYEKVPIEKAIASVVLGRIIDVICLLLVIGLTFVLGYDIFKSYFEDNLQLGSILYILGPMILVGIAGIGALIYINKLNAAGKIKNSFIKGFIDRINSFINTLLSIKNLENPGLFIAYSIGIWICYYLMTYLCFFAFEPVSHLGPLAGLIVFLFGTLGMVFPSPGGMGSYHFLVIQALIILGINATDANSFSYIIFFGIQIFCNVAFGLLFLILLPVFNKTKT